jgi:hypothetical protein
MNIQIKLASIIQNVDVEINKKSIDGRVVRDYFLGQERCLKPVWRVW